MNLLLKMKDARCALNGHQPLVALRIGVSIRHPFLLSARTVQHSGAHSSNALSGIKEQQGRIRAKKSLLFKPHTIRSLDITPCEIGLFPRDPSFSYEFLTARDNLFSDS